MVTFRQCNKVSCVVKATACTAALLLSVALLPSTALAAAADAEAGALGLSTDKGGLKTVPR